MKRYHSERIVGDPRCLEYLRSRLDVGKGSPDPYITISNSHVEIDIERYASERGVDQSQLEAFVDGLVDGLEDSAKPFFRKRMALEDLMDAYEAQLAKGDDGCSIDRPECVRLLSGQRVLGYVAGMLYTPSRPK